MNEELSKDLFSGKKEVEISFDESDIFNEVYNLDLTKEYIKHVEDRLTAVFEKRGYIDRYELWGALGMDLSRVMPIENDYLFIRER